MTGDRIVRATAAKGMVRGFFADTTETAGEAARIHNLTPAAAAALGRTLTATAILSKMLKSKKASITIQITGGGPIGKIIAAADSHANVRGYVENPDVVTLFTEDNKIDVGSAVGRKGRLTVMEDLGLKTPYIGSVELISGEIAEDFAGYFAISEQTPSVVALGVLVDTDLSIKRSGGYIIQLLPEAGEDTIVYFEDILKGIDPVTKLLEEEGSPEKVCDLILGGTGYTITEKYPVRYMCTCSAKRMKENIFALGKKDLQEILNDGKDIETVCHFCRKRYVFDAGSMKRQIEKYK